MGRSLSPRDLDGLREPGRNLKAEVAGHAGSEGGYSYGDLATLYLSCMCLCVCVCLCVSVCVCVCVRTVLAHGHMGPLPSLDACSCADGV